MTKGNLIVGLIIGIIAVGGYVYLRDSRSSNISSNTTSMSNDTSNVLGTATDTVASRLNKYKKAPAILPEADRSNKQVTIKTDKGDIVFKLFGDEAPMAVSNFIFLTKEGYYDGIIFHRREEGFVIQGGDPAGQGYGGPGYKFEDEPVTKEYTKGIVAMANSGPDTNGSQFFIMLDDVPLPPSYTIFGEVTKGMDVVAKIQIGDKMNTVTVSDL
ncbi:MAG: peptidylprolyl isomerase [Candidatus Dojkabacteria bacterium]